MLWLVDNNSVAINKSAAWPRPQVVTRSAPDAAAGGEASRSTTEPPAAGAQGLGFNCPLFAQSAVVFAS